MTREDIIRLMREAGWIRPSHVCIPWSASVDELERFAALVAAEEREACARVCETEGSVDDLPMHYAEAIRARGEGSR